MCCSPIIGIIVLCHTYTVGLTLVGAWTFLLTDTFAVMHDHVCGALAANDTVGISQLWALGLHVVARLVAQAVSLDEWWTAHCKPHRGKVTEMENSLHPFKLSS